MAARSTPPDPATINQIFTLQPNPKARAALAGPHLLLIAHTTDDRSPTADHFANKKLPGKWQYAGQIKIQNLSPLYVIYTPPFKDAPTATKVAIERIRSGQFKPIIEHHEREEPEEDQEDQKDHHERNWEQTWCEEWGLDCEQAEREGQEEQEENDNEREWELIWHHHWNQDWTSNKATQQMRDPNSWFTYPEDTVCPTHAAQ